MSNSTDTLPACDPYVAQISQVGTPEAVTHGRHRLVRQPSPAAVLLGIVVLILATAIYQLLDAITDTLGDPVPDVTLEELGAVRSQLRSATQELATITAERVR